MKTLNLSWTVVLLVVMIGLMIFISRTGERWFDELKREWLEEHINDITLEQLEGLL